MTDHQIDYSFAGPGAKRRKLERQYLDDDNPPHKKSKHTRPYKAQNPANEKAAKESETINVTSRGLKHRIRTLTCNTEKFSDMYSQLKQANFPGSEVLASSVRRDMLECIRVMIEVGLIDEDDLARHRRRMTQSIPSTRPCQRFYSVPTAMRCLSVSVT